MIVTSRGNWSHHPISLQSTYSRFSGTIALCSRLRLRQHQNDEFDRLGLDVPFFETEDGDRLELSIANIQNCLCELYKYHKNPYTNGRGRRCFQDSEARSDRGLRSIYETAPHIQPLSENKI